MAPYIGKPNRPLQPASSARPGGGGAVAQAPAPAAPPTSFRKPLVVGGMGEPGKGPAGFSSGAGGPGPAPYPLMGGRPPVPGGMQGIPGGAASVQPELGGRPDIQSAIGNLRAQLGMPGGAGASNGMMDTQTIDPMPGGEMGGQGFPGVPSRLQALAARDPAAAVQRYAQFRAHGLPGQQGQQSGIPQLQGPPQMNAAIGDQYNQQQQNPYVGLLRQRLNQGGMGGATVSNSGGYSAYGAR